MESGPQFAVTLAMALAFAGVHIFIGRLRFLDATPRSGWLSFAGGVAVGFVFLHIMPELGAHSETFEQATGFAEPLAEGWVYTLALFGLALFYGIERSIVISRKSPAEGGSSARPGSGILWLHIAATSLLALIIAYLLSHREDQSAAGLAIYFAAMTLHFMSADYGMRTDHPETYDRQGRWVLAGATMAGWGAGMVFDLPELMIGCLFAFVGGGIILAVLKEELPEERQSRFWPFAGGAALYSALLLSEQWLMGG